MKRLSILFPAIAFIACAADWIPRDTNISIRTNEEIRIRATEGDGRVYPGSVSYDVRDRDGNMLIPRGSPAELIVRRIGQDEVAVDLDSVTVNGHRYGVAATETEAEGAQRGGGARRTGEFAGGGAVLGTILGAVAGGGKGALVGALAGGGAGAGAGILTRGSRLNVPAEAVLNFRLEQPIRIDAPDNGHDRDGHHYHDNWDHSQHQ